MWYNEQHCASVCPNHWQRLHCITSSQVGQIHFTKYWLRKRSINARLKSNKHPWHCFLVNVLTTMIIFPTLRLFYSTLFSIRYKINNECCLEKSCKRVLTATYDNWTSNKWDLITENVAKSFILSRLRHFRAKAILFLKQLYPLV